MLYYLGIVNDNFGSDQYATDLNLFCLYVKQIRSCYDTANMKGLISSLISLTSQMFIIIVL